MKKIVKTALSIILATAILLTQASVFAVTLIDSPQKIPVSDVFVMAEDVSKRGEFEKHYLCSDGTFIVASYAEAIHYKNENGEWVDIDNQVSYNALTQSYRAGNQTFSAEFASISDTSKLVTMKSGEHIISWGLTTDKSASSQTMVKSATSTSVSAEAVITPSVTLKNSVASTKNSKALVTDEETFKLEKVSGGIAYDKIIAGSPEISVDYSVYYNKIEEDIYINSKTDVKSISMNLSVGTLVARKNADNSVSLLDDEGEPEYTIGVPYMEDASGEILNKIKVTVSQSGSNCVITYTPDEAWLNSDERVYPILLDPSITTREYSSNIVDTYVYEGNSENHSSERKNIVGIKSSKIHRTFIKITNLPAIDPSMPVIGATLTLTLPSGTSSGRTAALYKLNSDWTPSTITYANQPSFTEADKIGTCPFNASTAKFVFDLTADFASMYNDFLAGVNYGYVLKYDDESKTDPDYNSTYGMEQTTVAYRPLFTVTYGYSLPTELSAGGVYAFQNLGTGAYITVHNGTDANDVNVYQKSTLPANLGTNQTFKLEYVSSTGAYRLRAMCSSDANGRVLDIVKSGGYVNDGGNVQIYNPTDSLANEWFLIGAGLTTFRIIPRTNMSLSLTACPGGDGTSAGTTPTSAGNVYVATTDSNSDYQEWYIRDMSTNTVVSSGGNYGGISNGTYYINNSYTGKYMYRSPRMEYIDGKSGLISELGNKIRWTIAYVEDGAYTIRSVEDPTLFIVPDDLIGRIVLDPLPDGNDIPDKYLWVISTAMGGGVKIRNVATGEYLYSSGETTNLGETLPSTSSENYDKYVWRMANVNVLNERPELREISVLDFQMLSNDAQPLDIMLSSSKALWTSGQDFRIAFKNNVTLSSDKKLTISVPGTYEIALVHKPTNLRTEFNVTVVPLLESPDDLLPSGQTRTRLIELRRAINDVENSCAQGKIDQNVRNIIVEELNNQSNIVRADYIVVGDNIFSDYAYAALGGDSDSLSPFPEDISYSGSNPVTGLEIVVLQRAMEVLGYYEPGPEGYGTYDYDTYYSAQQVPNMLFNNKFTSLSCIQLFNDSTKSVRTFEELSSLNQLRVLHNVVADAVAVKVDGTSSMSANRINNGNYNGTYYGYADVLKDTGLRTYVWEIKRDRERYFSPAQHIGISQIRRYISASTLYDQNFTRPLVGGYRIPAFCFRYEDKMIYVRPAPQLFDVSDALVLYDKEARDGIEYAYEEVLSEVPEPTYNAVKLSHTPEIDTETLGNVVIGGLVIFGATLFAYTIVSTGGFILLPVAIFIG